MTKPPKLQMLVGWKQISAWMQRAPNTLRKYKHEYGMPIYYDPSGSPVAFPAELTAWLKIHEFRRMEDNITIETPNMKGENYETD